jgi:hypothetical protein
MQAALQLFDDLGIKTVRAYYQKAGPGPLQTAAAAVVARMIRNRGLPHATLVLRAIAESSDANRHALIADIIEAVSDLIIGHPRWAGTGLALLEAFDSIDLVGIRKIAKAAKIRPLRAGIATLVAVELERLLGPSALPKPAKVKIDRKPPARLTRVPGVEKNIALGLELMALRSAIKGNSAFGRQMRRQFDVDAQHAAEVMKVARVYGSRPEIFSRLSWNALLHLASPALSAAAREALEARIRAGEAISATEIRAARGPLKPTGPGARPISRRRRWRRRPRTISPHHRPRSHETKALLISAAGISVRPSPR